MQRSLCWGQRKYQPALASIYRAKPEDIRKECAIGFRILAVQKNVSRSNHIGLQTVTSRSLHLQPPPDD
jgi:hypothetical protein